MPYASVTVPLKLGATRFKLSTISLKDSDALTQNVCSVIPSKNSGAASALASMTAHRANYRRSKIADRPS